MHLSDSVMKSGITVLILPVEIKSWALIDQFKEFLLLASLEQHDRELIGNIAEQLINLDWLDGNGTGSQLTDFIVRAGGDDFLLLLAEKVELFAQKVFLLGDLFHEHNDLVPLSHDFLALTWRSRTGSLDIWRSAFGVALSHLIPSGLDEHPVHQESALDGSHDVLPDGGVHLVNVVDAEVGNLFTAFHTSIADSGQFRHRSDTVFLSKSGGLLLHLGGEIVEGVPGPASLAQNFDKGGISLSGASCNSHRSHGCDNLSGSDGYDTSDNE